MKIDFQIFILSRIIWNLKIFHIETKITEPSQTTLFLYDIHWNEIP